MLSGRSGHRYVKIAHTRISRIARTARSNAIVEFPRQELDELALFVLDIANFTRAVADVVAADEDRAVILLKRNKGSVAKLEQLVLHSDMMLNQEKCQARPVVRDRRFGVLFHRTLHAEEDTEAVVAQYLGYFQLCVSLFEKLSVIHDLTRVARAVEKFASLLDDTP